MPGDPRALDAYLRVAGREMSPEEITQVIAETLAAAPTTADRARICALMKRRRQTADAVSCFRAVVTATDDAKAAARYTKALVELLIQLRRWSELDELLAASPDPELAPKAALKLAEAGECDLAVGLYAAIDLAHLDDQGAESMAGGLARCQDEAGAGALMRAGLQKAPIGRVSRLLTAWREALPAHEVEAILRSRLEREADRREPWNLLDEHLHKTAQAAKRLAHLRAWAAHGDGHSAPLSRLASALEEAGRIPEAIAAYQELLASWPDHGVSSVSWAQSLVKLHLETGDLEPARQVASTLAGRTSETTDAIVGYVSLAQVELAAGNPEAAIGNYRYFYSHAEPDLWPTSCSQKRRVDQTMNPTPNSRIEH